MWNSLKTPKEHRPWITLRALDQHPEKLSTYILKNTPITNNNKLSGNPSILVIPSIPFQPELLWN